VHPELTWLLAKRNDVLLRADFRPGAHSTLDRAVARGELTRLFPRTYVRTTRLTEPWVRWAAALRYAGNCAALSFVTGLQFWRLMPPSPGAVHITIGGDRELRGGRGLVVHRRTGFRPEPPLALRRDGLVAAVLERCVVESWPVLPATLRREPVIYAIQSRRTTPARLRAEAATLPRLPGRRALLDLVGVLDVGCASELEIWGHLHVFTGPDSPTCVVSLLCTSVAVPYIWIWPTRPPWSPSSCTARRTTTTRWLESVTGGGTPCSPRSGG